MAERNLTLWDSDNFDFNGVRDQIVDLRGRGYPVTYICKATGLTDSVVRRILKSEFVDRNSSRQDLIESHSQEIKWIKLKITERIHGAGEKWDRRDAELLLKVHEREAKLFGLDQPSQQQISVTYQELSDDDLVSQLRAQGVEIKQLPQHTPTLPPPPAEVIQDAEVVHVSPNTHQPPPTAETGPDSCGQ